MQRISPYFCEFVTLDTRTNSKYFKDFSANEIDDKSFKKAIRQIEGRFNSPVLVTETIVSHYGYVNGNYRWYDPAYGKFNAQTLIRPSAKPILKNHDRYEDPLGRVLIAKYENIPNLSKRQMNDLKTRTGYVKSFGYITGKENVEKVMDERYLTVSIGGRSPEVRCSICNTNLIQESCEHELGETYDKKLAYLVYGMQEYVEYSYVNTPADVEARTQRHQLITNQDHLTSDYAELVRATMVSDQAIPIESFEDDRYLAYMTDAKSSVFFSFDESRMLQKDEVFGKQAPEELSVERGENDENQKQNQTTSKQEDDAVDIKEATLDDLLRLGIIKDHLNNTRKEDAETIAQKEKIIETKDAEIAKVKTELEDDKKVIIQKDEEINKINDDLKKYQEIERDAKVTALMDLMIKLEKPKVRTVLDEKDAVKQKEIFDEITKEIAKRSDESISDTITDLQAELKAKGDDLDGNGLTQTVTDDVTQNNNRTPGAVSGKKLNPISAILGTNSK